MVNGKTYQNLAVNVTQHNTEIYDGLPCPSNENPCHNGGVCLPLLNSYLCKCASGYNGLHCEFCKSFPRNFIISLVSPYTYFSLYVLFPYFLSLIKFFQSTSYRLNSFKSIHDINDRRNTYNNKIDSFNITYFSPLED